MHAAASPELHTLSLHDALPIYGPGEPVATTCASMWSSAASERSPDACALERPSTRDASARRGRTPPSPRSRCPRSEEHTSELQSQSNLVCRLLLEKKNKTDNSS